MSTAIQPWTLLFVAVAGWIQREQQLAIEYLLEENCVLKARLRGKRLRFTDDERRRLAAKGKVFGRKLLAEVAGIVTPNTLLAWHLKLIAKKRFVLSIKSECLERMIFFGERCLHHAVAEFVRHYHGERNHQGLDNQLIEPNEAVGHRKGSVQCHQRLGGMLNYYYRLCRARHKRYHAGNLLMPSWPPFTVLLAHFASPHSA
jgi:hypothetical protein